MAGQKNALAAFLKAAYSNFGAWFAVEFS